MFPATLAPGRCTQGDANQDGPRQLPRPAAHHRQPLRLGAGIAVAPVGRATPTATVTNTPTFASPTATATALPTASVTATAAATATATATSAIPTATSTAAATVSPTASATATAAAPATASATATLTRTPTATSVPTPDAAALAGTAAQIANGMNAIPAVITALVSGVKFGAALIYDPDAQLAGVGGPAGACPLGGSAISGCIAATGTTTVAFDSRVPTASGSVTIDELPPTDPAISLDGSLCAASLPCRRGADHRRLAVFRDAQNAPSPRPPRLHRHHQSVAGRHGRRARRWPPPAPSAPSSPTARRPASRSTTPASW
ncbi:MAG: hypothetical protein U0802_24310 [Candidatus Binatia bacterium]